MEPPPRRSQARHSARPSTSLGRTSSTYPRSSSDTAGHWATPGPSSSRSQSDQHAGRTPRTSTTTSGRLSRAASSIGAGEGHQIVCAVSESRGVSPTVGVALVNISTGEAVLSQICDNQSYVKTTHKIAVFEPSRVLIVSSACPPNPKSSLCATIEEELPGIPLVPLSRSYWSETAGLEFIQALAFKQDVEAVKVAVEGSFYAVCSFAAAMKYLELEFSVRIASHTLRIKYQPSEESMMIDLSTIHSLELIQSLRHPKSKACLFCLLNQTMTPMGARMLRSNILQPSTQKDGILMPRYDAVDELCTKEDMFFELRKALKEFTDVEKLLTQLIILPPKSSLQATEQAINQVLLVKTFMRAAPAVFRSLGSARSMLLTKIRDLCRPEITASVGEAISKVINEDVAYASRPLELRNQRIFAVKSGVQGLLDVARKTFKEATAYIHEHVEQINEELQLAADLQFDNSRRYYLRYRVVDFEDGRLPDILINVVKRREFVECQTLEMVKLNQRITDCDQEVLMQSDKVIQQLLDAIRVEVPHLFRICEGIGLLDMLASFAHLTTTHDYVKPDLKDALVLKSARHPILEQRLENFIPNDFYATEQYRFQIITGCNMSGKSTYIRTIALLQIMAQIGCFVPAQYASFPIISNLFSRVSTDDSIESNMSTFSVEMREMAFILRNINQKSLAIIDELGRGTSTRDGLAIAVAIGEALVQSNALVLFATHFLELAHVLGGHPGVLNLHLATKTTAADSDHQVPRMTMLYRISAGVLSEQNYGINLARAIGFPPSFIQKAEQVSTTLRQLADARRQSSQARKLERRRKLVLNLRETLMQAYESEMDDNALASYLRRLQSEFVTRMEEIESNVEAGQDDGESDRTGASIAGSGRVVEA
ncbi:MutS domain V [Pleurostoma richardsiae]|uniref:DNA mismatch repair protein MSH3 n=1 Tax=Pleurostoma richardsiae TaxID=41990 RepID=A0AA38RL49_9PEZI|nr:MutS domain V [Pleurostoma richardsiae]